MINKPLHVVVFALAPWFGSCASNGLAASWIDPSVQSRPEFRKVFVAYLGADQSVQRVAEDALAAHLQAPEVVRFYELFPNPAGLDAAKVKARLIEQGFDGALVMRTAGTEQEVSWEPSAYPVGYRSFGGYWGATYPAEMRTDVIVYLETNVYSLAQDKLLYAARSETFNPESTKELVDEVARDIADDLEKKGIVRAGK